MNQEGESVLLLDDHHGVYTPQEFAQWHADEFDIKGVSHEDMATLRMGPTDEEATSPFDYSQRYWEAWDSVLGSAEKREDPYKGWTLYQFGGGAVFLVSPDFVPEDAP